MAKGEAQGGRDEQPNYRARTCRHPAAAQDVCYAIGVSDYAVALGVVAMAYRCPGGPCRNPLPTGEPLEWRWDMYEQHKHLLELLGILEYLPAESLFRQYIPVPPLPPPDHKYMWIHCTHRSVLRSRAIFALGKIHQGQPADDLVRPFVERLKDSEEVSHVVAMSALALGRMKAIDTLPELKSFYQPGGLYTASNGPESVRALASRVALELMTGEKLPELTVEPYLIYRSDWFLEPLDVKGKR